MLRFLVNCLVQSDLFQLRAPELIVAFGDARLALLVKAVVLRCLLFTPPGYLLRLVRVLQKLVQQIDLAHRVEIL